jgi:AcrR family transcriptional regulator
MSTPPDAEPSRATPSTPTPLRGRDPTATKKRLLDAAETLFAERGFEGTSMRAVTHAAGVSVSAANYHFGSKEALLRATLWRVIEPVNRARFESLDRLDRAAEGDAALTVESILDAFLRPALAGRRAPGMGAARYRQVAARLFSDPPELVSSLKREYFAELLERYVMALQRALPGRPIDQLRTALEFTVAVMVHVISGQLDAWSDEHASAPAEFDDEEILRRMIRYAAAGLRSVPLGTDRPGGVGAAAAEGSTPEREGSA